MALLRRSIGLSTLRRLPRDCAGGRFLSRLRSLEWSADRLGAPLETIGVMTRSLREHSRPRPIAYWSQGAHAGWGGRWNPRRPSPTPDELRSQAWHGLANRITSLYWFNLSFQSLVQFPDLIDPITRVNREIRMLDEILLTGDAYEYRRIEHASTPIWDLNSIASPDAALLVAHDLSYHADTERNEFVFESQSGNFQFNRPPWLSGQIRIFKVDADGTHDVEHKVTHSSIEIRDQVDVVGIYLVTADQSMRDRMEARYQRLIEQEQAVAFDPASNPDDLARLKGYLEQ